ncbi:MAG TPA: DUF2911 domain-containing protein [Polyangia bacterium]|nr:DUF2911 domain-containing protein [Polyangia bacterium]
MTTNRFVLAAACIATVSLGAVAVSRADKDRASPHAEVSGSIAGKKITITYGRPYKKGRDIWGGLVPWDKVWRTGADEATTLTTDGDIHIGTLKVPKGSYALFTIPSQKKAWELIVNKNPKQWGAFKYDPKEDLGKTEMKTGSGAEPVEQLTITIDPNGPKAALLKIAWDDVQARVPITP